LRKQLDTATQKAQDAMNASHLQDCRREVEAMSRAEVILSGAAEFAASSNQATSVNAWRRPFVPGPSWHDMQHVVQTLEHFFRLTGVHKVLSSSTILSSRTTTTTSLPFLLLSPFSGVFLLPARLPFSLCRADAGQPHGQLFSCAGRRWPRAGQLGSVAIGGHCRRIFDDEHASLPAWNRPRSASCRILDMSGKS